MKLEGVSLDVQRLREDFQVLQKDFDGKKIVYLDSACMALKPNQVIEKMNEYYYEFPGCGDRSVHRIATRVTIAVEEARVKLQKLINAKEHSEIIFLRNATEGINLVAHSLTQGLSLGPKERVLTTDREHNSNLVPWLNMQNHNGMKTQVVHSNPDNTFNIETFESMMDKTVKLVSMVHTSNLDGYTIPAKEIIEIAHDYGALVLLDGAQSAPHIPVDVQDLDVDFFVLSIHKMCGPTGMGVIYAKQSLLENLPPYIVGGSTVKSTTYTTTEFLKPPEKFEAGLQNYAGIIGAGVAADYIRNIGLEEIHQHDMKLNEIMTESLGDIEKISVIGPKDPKLRGCTFSFNITDFDCHDIAMILDEVGNIMIRSGMHCVHSWFNNNNINGSARASVYLYNTEDEIKFFCEKILEIIKNFN
jgi:cysteine desulfurase/selenocysteine lyase